MFLTIPIPDNTRPLVKIDQKIDFDTPLFEVGAVTEITIPLAKKLNIAPSKIFHYLKKFVGEEVKEGEILAAKKTIFSSKKILSPLSGIIKEIDHNLGVLIIETKLDKKRIINSSVIGEIIEINKNTLKIKINQGKEFLLKKSSPESFGGEVFYFQDNSVLNAEKIKNKIIFTESLSSYFQSKIEALGAVGVITLKAIDEKSELKFAQLKNIDDMEKIINLNFPYCFIDSVLSKIIFYAQ